ncbi:hypothetical protein SADUNF_Sadunf05G0095000 [Salix dunnii]|uniref:Homeobox-leucine zipper protein n=1 Tax=Salix dunnii TaxID=1413687 RepID=A0A835K3B5_9ROSI|nr:hypothetical protein SADUNF_Sadunf05G0095000 [Salix dunnii]
MLTLSLSYILFRCMNGIVEITTEIKVLSTQAVHSLLHHHTYLEGAIRGREKARASRKTTTMNHKVGDLISQLHPCVYTQMIPKQGESIPRRRRRKKNTGDDGISGAKKRQLSAEQVSFLEMHFGNEHKLETERKDKLASDSGLDPRQVAVWFQNRRTRWKNKKLEEEYTKLKTAHESIVVEKCLLESEVLKLKEQLSKTEKEIQRLSDQVDRVSTGSPSSPLSMAMDPPFLGEFALEGYEDAFYMHPENNYIPGMEWINQYI